jgi:hypothetical protein
MTLEEKINKLKSQYDVIAVVDLDPWHDLSENDKKQWMRQILSPIYQDTYLNNQRIIFKTLRGDVYADEQSPAGQLITQLQCRLNEIDISNFFVILLTNDVTMRDAYLSHYRTFSKDPVPFTVDLYSIEITERRLQDKITKKLKIFFNI